MTSEKTPTITAVIPMHNGLPHIIACINSLKLQECDDFNLRIIVVDDGSTDNSAGEIGKKFNDIQILSGDGNLWWTGAIAVGTRKALDDDADYIFWINEDDTLSDGALQNLLQSLRKNKKGIAGCGVVFDSNSDRIVCGYSLRYFKWYSQALYYPRSHFLSPTFVSNCDLNGGHGILIPQTLFTQGKAVIRPAIFPHYFGDFDFYVQARKLGYKPYIVGGVLVLSAPPRAVVSPASVGLLTGRRIQSRKHILPYLFSRKSQHNLRDRPLFALLDFPPGLNLIWALLFVMASFYCVVFFPFRKKDDIQYLR